MYRQDNAEMWWGEDGKVDEVDPKRWSRSWRRFTSKANKRGQIKILILLNRVFVYYYADFYFCYEQVVIAAMSAALALAKKKRNSFIQQRKTMFFTAVIHRFWVYIFIGSFQRTFTQNTDWRTFFAPCIWFACFFFQKNILVHFVTATGITKPLMQSFSTAKTKTCSISINEFHCFLGRLFSRFQQIWKVKREI